MAKAGLINHDDPSFLQVYQRPGYRKLGLLNGLLIGLAMVMGAWGPEAWKLWRLPMPLAYGGLVIASLILLLLYGFTGWLTSRLANAWITVISWALVGIIASLFVGYQPTVGRTMAVWLVDRRFWGIPVYPAINGGHWAVMLGGIFIILIFVVLALLQGQRLDSAQHELKKNTRLSARAWLILLIPLPLVAVAGWATASMPINPSATAANVVLDAITTTWDYEGDLVELGLQRGSNYGAVRAVQDQMSGEFTLNIGQIDPASSIALILAEFDNGAWITCRVINDQLSHCYDATPPYTIGLASLITGEPVPEECRRCPLHVKDETADWLRQQRDLLGDNPKIERLAQWGGYVLMGVTSETGDKALECMFNSMSPVELDRCEFVSP
jgi:hypothetical protein